jgi:hypothetical protein
VGFAQRELDLLSPGLLCVFLLRPAHRLARREEHGRVAGAGRGQLMTAEPQGRLGAESYNCKGAEESHYQPHVAWCGDWFAFPPICTSLVITANFIKGSCLRA